VLHRRSCKFLTTQFPSSYPSHHWYRDVFFLIERTSPTDYPSRRPNLLVLPRWPNLQVTRRHRCPPSSSNTPVNPKFLPCVPEALAIRAFLQSTGALTSFMPNNPRAAFVDYESAGRNGFGSSWFRLGREYENFNDHQHARDCFERGVRLGVESRLYVCLPFPSCFLSLTLPQRMGMAHLLGQLSLLPNPSLALPLLHRAALLASLTQPMSTLSPSLRLYPALSLSSTFRLCSLHPPRFILPPRSPQTPRTCRIHPFLSTPTSSQSRPFPLTPFHASNTTPSLLNKARQKQLRPSQSGSVAVQVAPPPPHSPPLLLVVSTETSP
jgi:hypothetical protein